MAVVVPSDDASSDEHVTIDGGSDEQLAGLYTTDAKLVAATRTVFAAHTTLQQEVHARMKHVCRFQSQIQKMARSISGYRDSLQSLEQYFAELEHVPFISAAFKAGLSEVRRRREFREAYASKAMECTDSIKKLVQCEVGVRKAFEKTHGQHLPPALIPGLAELPPVIDIEIPGFDMDLPSLESLALLEPEDCPPAESDADFEPEMDKSQTEFYSPRKKPLDASVSPKCGDEEEAAAEEDTSDDAPENEAAAPEEAAAEEEETDEQPAPREDNDAAVELVQLRLVLEKVRQERDVMKQSMLEAEWKLSNNEALAKSMEETRMNNTNLEVQLSEAKSSVEQLMDRLDARSSTLNEVRQIMGSKADSMHSSAAGSSSNTSTMSESMHDGALLECLRAQRAVCDEVDRLTCENSELNTKLQYQQQAAPEQSGRLSLALSDFVTHDWMCFQLCSSCTHGEFEEPLSRSSSSSSLTHSVAPHVYEAISDQGNNSHWFLPPSQPEIGVQPARLVIGQMVEAEALVAEGSDNVFGLPAGSSYYCVTLSEEKKFA